MTLEHERQEQFERCVDACADSLFRVAFRLTGNRTLAHELVQETYLSAWKGIGSLKSVERMKGWLFAILRNQYTKLIRKESRAASTREHLDSIAATSNSNEAVVDAVQAAIGQLDEKHKLPVLLVAMEGLSVDDAAAALELPRGTVLSRLHRGRQKLKLILTAELSGVIEIEGHDGI
ncbi:MAG: RNA polymerase sigma-70 factor (ECF subfamily) [Mariniblastus sp.]|jgi:RNA polymerase sigma-70 factor (ECF subfamily)